MAVIGLGVITLFACCVCKEQVETKKGDVRDRSYQSIRIHEEVLMIKQPEKLKINPIGTFTVHGGRLYVYNLGSDTIYLVEGSTNCPLSLQVK